MIDASWPMSDAAPDDGDHMPPGLAWAGVVVLTLCGAASAWLECLLVPLYLGSVIVPIAVAFALVGNWALPRMARTLVPTTLASVLPFLGWLAIVLVFGVNGQPEGDVILPGGGGALQYTAYGVMLGGALAGTISVVTSAPPPPPRKARR